MAQNLQPGRSDNRGGNKPKTSTKKLFIYRVERSKHEELRAYAIKLNEEAEAEKEDRYSIVKYLSGLFFADLNLCLSKAEAEEKNLELNNRAVNLGFPETYAIRKLPCNTTEK